MSSFHEFQSLPDLSDQEPVGVERAWEMRAKVARVGRRVVFMVGWVGGLVGGLVEGSLCWAASCFGRVVVEW